MFARRIRELREEKGLTQVEVARAVHISSRAYQDLEASRKPRYETLLAVADLFDVSVDWLMGRTEKREVNR